MGSFYSGDHNAEDHIHTDITYNIEESQEKYCLGTVSYRLLGAETCFTGSKPLPFTSAMIQNIW